MSALALGTGPSRRVQPHDRASTRPGPSPARHSPCFLEGYRRPGPLAQRVEQGTFNPQVLGSRPRRPTPEAQCIQGFRAGHRPGETAASHTNLRCHPQGVPSDHARRDQGAQRRRLGDPSRAGPRSDQRPTELGQPHGPRDEAPSRDGAQQARCRDRARLKDRHRRHLPKRRRPLAHPHRGRPQPVHPPAVPDPAEQAHPPRHRRPASRPPPHDRARRPLPSARLPSWALSHHRPSDPRHHPPGPQPGRPLGLDRHESCRQHVATPSRARRDQAARGRPGHGAPRRSPFELSRVRTVSAPRRHDRSPPRGTLRRPLGTHRLAHTDAHHLPFHRRGARRTR